MIERRAVRPEDLRAVLEHWSDPNVTSHHRHTRVLISDEAMKLPDDGSSGGDFIGCGMWDEMFEMQAQGMQDAAYTALRNVFLAGQRERNTIGSWSNTSPTSVVCEHRTLRKRCRAGFPRWRHFGGALLGVGGVPEGARGPAPRVFRTGCLINLPCSCLSSSSA